MRRVALTIAIAAAAVAVVPLRAHKPVTSKYTFTEDVYPIVKEHCGGCHVPGGIAPMSLMTYEDARPWAESIRVELTSGHMPPWYGDPGVAPLRDVHKLSPRDLDVVLTWATGGTPPGPTAKNMPTPRRSWAKGRPDVVLQMPAAVTLAADKTEDTQEVVLREDNDRDRMIAFADLLPGNAAIVHDAVIFARQPGAAEPAAVFSVWVPGSLPAAPSPGWAFPWRAHEQLVLRVHYKKNWKLENKTASDRSAVGLYLTKSPAREIRGLALRGGDTLPDHVQAVAVRVAGGGSDAPMRVSAIRPDGTRLTIAGFVARAGWDRRYWLARPVDLPKGTRIDVERAATANVQIWLDASAM